jgi:hypothetical protein
LPAITRPLPAAKPEKNQKNELKEVSLPKAAETHPQILKLLQLFIELFVQ